MTVADRAITEAIVTALRTELERQRPVVVALDGRSGSGKSTLAVAVAAALVSDDPRLRVTVIAGDDFYAGGTPRTWDSRDAATKAANVIDWRRQRDVLTALRAGMSAEWHPFDWEAPDWDADTVPLRAEPERRQPADIVILEGAYSARPELADVVDVRVLVVLADDVRRARLVARDGETYHEDWARRWTEAEEHYFGSVVAMDDFDLVL